MTDKDTGGMNDMVKLTMTITDRNGRTHSYAYRNVMRYNIEERDDGNVYIHFRNDPFDRIHEAIKDYNNQELGGADLMRFLVGRDPRLLTGDPEAAGKTVGQISVAVGAMLSLIELKVNKATRCAVRDKFVQMVDVNTTKSTENTLRLLDEMRDGETIFNKQPKS